MRLVDLAQELEQKAESINTVRAAYNLPLKESVECKAAHQIRRIIAGAEIAKGTLLERMHIKQENAGYSVGFNDGEQHATRRVAEETLWAYNTMSALFAVILEDNDNAPG